MKWQTRAPYPYAVYIANAPTLYHKLSFLVFGGWNFGPHSSIIARYTPFNDEWIKLGRLKSGRSSSAVVSITQDSSFLVIGGNKGKTERCSMIQTMNDNNKMKCKHQTPDFKRLGLNNFVAVISFRKILIQSKTHRILLATASATIQSN